MMSVAECIIHFMSISSDNLIVLTDNKLSKLQHSAHQWVSTDKQPEKSIAERFIANYDEIEENEQHNVVNHKILHCHDECYLRFASQTKINKASSARHRRVC